MEKPGTSLRLATSARRLTPFPDGFCGHANRHCIWIATPRDYPYSRAFDEAAEALSQGFADLGGSAPIVRRRRDLNGRLPIVLGANLLPATGDTDLAPGTILFNFEQTVAGTGWFEPDYGYLSLMSRYPVLDFSPVNLIRLRALGIGHARLLELGYASTLTRFVPQQESLWDVVFVGLVNERRHWILSRLAEAGLRVMVVNDLFGAARDQKIAEAKIAVNIHFTDESAFEYLRIFYLLANRVCVVSEGDPDHAAIAPIASGLCLASYEGLVEKCIRLVRDDEARHRLAVRGFEVIRQRPQSTLLLRSMD